MEKEKNKREQPSYYGIMPAEVRYDERLSASEKVLYTEFSALTNKDGVCWATDGYFADLYNVSRQTVNGWISDLVKYGYLKKEIKYKEGSKEIEKRLLRLTIPILGNIAYSEKPDTLLWGNTPYFEKPDIPIQESTTSSIKKKTISLFKKSR